jgi:hypothetical protein
VPRPVPAPVPRPAPAPAPVPAACTSSQFAGQCIAGSTNPFQTCAFLYPNANCVPTCGSNNVCDCAGTACGCAVASPTSCPLFDLNFANAVRGEYVRNKWATSHGVVISAKKDTDCSKSVTAGYTPWGAARVFDTAIPGGDDGDTDLGSPNAGCNPSGPGIGDAGNPTIGTNSNVHNCVPQGMSLIVQESKKVTPDDNGCGGTITFDFYHTPAFITEVGLLDVDGNESVKLKVSDLPLFRKRRWRFDSYSGHFADSCFCLLLVR